MLRRSTSAMALEPLTPARRRQQTREYLLRAAAQVFAERGFHGASLDEVASVAGFTKGAVYSNFKNKEDLFLALLEAHFERELADVRTTLETTEGSLDAQLSEFARLIHLQEEGVGDSWATLYEEFHLYAMRNPAVRQQLADFYRVDVAAVAEIIEGERARQGIEIPESAEDAARFVVALMRGISMMRAIDPAVVTDAFLETVMVFLARALTGAGGGTPS